MQSINKRGENIMLTGKTVVLGVTGSIAAYKIANLARMLKKLNCNAYDPECNKFYKSDYL